MSFAEAAILFNLVVLTLIWSGLSAWFGYRRFQGRIFGYIVAAPILALLRRARSARASRASCKGVDPFVFFQDSAKLRHVVTAALVFGVLFAIVTALIAHLRNREYRALDRAPRGRGAPERDVAPARRVEAQAAATADRAAFPVQHAGERAAARGEGRAGGGAPDRRDHPLPARRDAGAARRDDDDSPGGGDDPRVPRHHADAARAAACVVGATWPTTSPIARSRRAW